MFAADHEYLGGLKELYLKQPGFQEADFEWLGGGMGFFGQKLIGATVAADLFNTTPRLELPVYVIQGRHDVSTLTAPAKAWFDALEAPKKQFIVLENAGHFALVTHREAFLVALRQSLAIDR